MAELKALLAKAEQEEATSQVTAGVAAISLSSSDEEDALKGAMKAEKKAAKKARQKAKRAAEPEKGSGAMVVVVEERMLVGGAAKKPKADMEVAVGGDGGAPAEGRAPRCEAVPDAGAPGRKDSIEWPNTICDTDGCYTTDHGVASSQRRCMTTMATRWGTPASANCASC